MTTVEVVWTLGGGLAAALVGGIVAGLIWELRLKRWVARIEHPALHDLLNFDRGRGLVFVFPTIGESAIPARKFRALAWGDAIAVAYMLRALAQCGWPADKISMRGVWRSPTGAEEGHFDWNHDWAQNLVIIGSPKTNPVAEIVLKTKLQTLQTQHRFGFDAGQTEDTWKVRLDEFCMPSPSFEQEALGESTLQDYGLVAKVQNPDYGGAKILFVAGIRAFGTWGVAKHLLENPDELRDRKSDLPPARDRDFATILEAAYDANQWRIHRVKRTGQFTYLDSNRQR